MQAPSFTFLHGFLGCPQDWDPITTDFSHPFTAPSLEDIKVTEGSILVGYSMGGRVALTLAAEAPDKFAGLILISTHPGIPDEQKPLRRAFEAQWLRVFRTMPRQKALDLWYAQKLFDNLRTLPAYPEMLQRRLSYPSSHELLSRYSLADQPNYFENLPDLPITYIYGEKDRKYANIAKRLKEKYPRVQITGVPDASHSLHIEQPEMTHDLLTKSLPCQV